MYPKKHVEHILKTNEMIEKEDPLLLSLAKYNKTIWSRLKNIAMLLTKRVPIPRSIFFPLAGAA